MERFVRDHDITLEQQRLNVAQAQAESEVPANRAADDAGREAMTMIKRFRLLHRFIPPPFHQPARVHPTVESAVPQRTMVEHSRRAVALTVARPAVHDTSRIPNRQT
ncbi:hypothetical protein J8I87_27125 [Paraburkholderia sp. LEh10]|nr:hypothetical protein [Paraburkholderia sp. LEh10]